MKKNPTTKLKETISNLEWKISQLEDYRTKYSDIKEKYDNEFWKNYFNLQQRNEMNYRDNQQFIEIIRWLINKETAMDCFVKEWEVFRNRNLWK